jgi:hypothetical protein
MRRTFNLAEWSINHRPFVTFVMIMLLAARVRGRTAVSAAPKIRPSP